MPSPKPHLNVDSNVVRQLGDELITDAEQALLELIKNSYDADAQVVRVRINTQDPSGGEARGLKRQGHDAIMLPEGKERSVGWISIEDDGTGMDRDAIEQGWLVISLSRKQLQKARGEKTALFNRTPLGDKGLGRLGTMKIGDVVEIVTHSQAGKGGTKVRLSWLDFVPGRLLTDVPVGFDVTPPAPRTGTLLTIRGLTEPIYWQGEERRQRLANRLSKLVSPFHRLSNFRISLEVDGSPVSLTEIGPELRNSATVHFEFNWSGAELFCQASFKPEILRGNLDRDEYEHLIHSDGGNAFATFYVAKARARGRSTRPPKESPWLIEVEETFESTNVLGEGNENPGPFVGEFDAFDFDAADGSDVFSNAEEYRAYIRRFAGIEVYRDNFAIRMAEDWLQLGQAWTTGRGYYSLKPANTLGYFAISAAGNPQLKEKSDREGFLDTQAARGFMSIAKGCVQFANLTLNDIRRQFNKYKTERLESAAHLQDAWKTQDAVGALRKAHSSLRQAHAKTSSSADRRVEAVRKVRAQLARISQDPTVSKGRSLVTEAIAELDKVLAAWEEQRRELDGAIAAISDEEAVAAALLNRFDLLKGQVTEVYESVALGMVAEGLAHEMEGVLEDLIARTNRVAVKAKKSGDPALVGYLEAVRSTVHSLRKQVSFLDPMLRTTREQRTVFSVSAFVTEFVALRSERLEGAGIILSSTKVKDFSVRMSRGRLQQVLDNLVRNSEFWIRQSLETKGGPMGKIAIEVSRPSIVVSDSGPGVNRNLEAAIFEPFISGKPGGTGRGLGLFITQQLLRRDGCDLALESNRNRSGNRFRFQVDLKNVEQNGE